MHKIAQISLTLPKVTYNSTRYCAYITHSCKLREIVSEIIYDQMLKYVGILVLLVLTIMEPDYRFSVILFAYNLYRVIKLEVVLRREFWF